MRRLALKKLSRNALESISSYESSPQYVCKLCTKKSKLTLFKRSLKFFSCVSVTTFILATVLRTLFDINQIYLYFLIGFCVSFYASWLKLQFYLNPNYQSGCNCVSSDKTETMYAGVITVLQHKKSAILFGIPNTCLGVLYYTFMVLINGFQRNLLEVTEFASHDNVNNLTFVMTLISCIGSAYLWFTMVSEVRSVCVICSTIHAISFLTLLTFV